jgi:hypothetical protein
MASMTDQLPPSRTDLDAATARTASVMADPEASLSDRLLAAEAEEATHLAYFQRPGKNAELQAEAEMDAERTAAATDAGSRWPENQPVPYTLTSKAEALLETGDGDGARRTVRRSWTLTAKAEALLAAQSQPEQVL